MTLVILAIGLIACSDTTHGDEIVISARSSRNTIGDFGLSPGRFGSSSRLNLSSSTSPFDQKTGHCEVKAGDLWKYFKSQGVDSLDSLVLFLDVEKMDRSSSMALESLEVSIIRGVDDSGFPTGEVISFLSMDKDGDNRLVIPGYESNSSRPEARLELPLGFDFMERFSESSTETLMVNVSYDGDLTLSPVLSIEGKQQLFSAPSLVILVSFIVFWASVFWILKRMTLPQKPRIATESEANRVSPVANEKKSAAPAA